MYWQTGRAGLIAGHKVLLRESNAAFDACRKRRAGMSLLMLLR
jgi:hypothetical protein